MGPRQKGPSTPDARVGTGHGVSLLELVAALNRALGTALAPVFDPTRAGDVKFSRADVTRARADLGYPPLVEFEDGLRQTVEWHLRARELA